MCSTAKDIEMDPIEWIFGFQRFGVKLDLDRISFLVKKLENPQDNYRVIHVGGTNGKGSVCRYLASILSKAGYRVGLYTSPHLIRFNERIVVDGKEIGKEELSKEVEKLIDLIEEMKDPPTFFEITTAIALDYFREKEVDFAVIEVGLGGRLDATNVVNPVVSIITNVYKDHAIFLGNDIRKIAAEKAGIIKNAPVVTAARGEALDVIRKVAKERRTKLSIVRDNSWRRLRHDLHTQTFLVEGELADYQIETKMLGKFQGENIANSIYAIENLQLEGVYLSEDDILQGFLEARNPGRMDILNKEPLIILDGAHNPSGMEALVESLEDFSYRKLIAIVGALADKDVHKMLLRIAPKADVMIATQPKNPRACDAEELARVIKKFGKEPIVEPNVEDAITIAMNLAEGCDMICVTGSLYTIGEALFMFKNKKDKNSLPF